MNNAARKQNIYLHRVPDFGFIKHKNDRWRLVERLYGHRGHKEDGVVSHETHKHYIRTTQEAV